MSRICWGAFVARVLVNIFVVFPIKSLRPHLDVDIKIWNSKLALEALNTSCLDALGIDIGNLLQYQTASHNAERSPSVLTGITLLGTSRDCVFLPPRAPVSLVPVPSSSPLPSPCFPPMAATCSSVTTRKIHQLNHTLRIFFQNSFSSLSSVIPKP